MRIVKLQSENVKRLKAVEIAPDPNGSLVVIRGENGQGKTSVLDSIAYALGGKDLQPPKVIREGAERAQVVVDLGDLVVERRWTANDRSYLEVRGKDGSAHKSPQALLDKMVGSLTFDPLAFMRLEPAKQAETLRQLVGLDFSALDAQRQKLYEERTLIGREGKALRARFDALPEVEVPTATASIDELLAEQAKLQAQKDANALARLVAQNALSHLEVQRASLAKARAAVEQLERDSVNAREAAAGWERALTQAVSDEERARKAAEALVEPDLDGVRTRIAAVSAAAEVAAKKKERERIGAELEAKRAESVTVSEQIAALDAQKAAQLTTAKFPVEGMSLTEGGLALKGIPLEQASSAEQLRVSLAMGLALNPKLKVLLIRDGSLLDARNLHLVGEMAAAAGAQVWLEVVGKGGVGVVIEDGQVEGATAAKPTAAEPEPPKASKQAKAPF
ncbi:MAG: AAA family ATPase [Candidatus Acidiferrales bacterium]